MNITKQIAAALGATHAAGIVHRDVKPRNVMLIEGERDVVKLIDFGLAKLSVKEVSDLAASRASMADQQITGTGAVFGTIAYLAPEAALGMDSVDVRADLYALGLVLYEMLAGRHPFDDGRSGGALQAPRADAAAAHRGACPRRGGAARGRGGGAAAPGEEARRSLPERRSGDRRARRRVGRSAHTPTPSPVSLGEHVFPGPSILPPPPATTPPPPVTAPIAGRASPAPRAPTSTSPPSMPSATAPSAVRDIEPPAPSQGRSRWLYAAGIAGMALVAAAVWWSGSETPSGGVATVAAAETTATAKSNGASSAVASAVPSSSAASSAAATAAASGAPVVAMDPGVARAALRRAAAARDVYRGQEAFYALADREPAAFREPLVAAAARDLATVTALAGGGEMDRLFDALARKLGGDGLDILYEIVRVRGGSKAAARAEAALREPGVMDQATPALRVTWALRDAPCAEKAALLDKATSEGDVGTLMVMQTTALSCLGAQNEALRNATKTLKLKAH